MQDESLRNAGETSHSLPTSETHTAGSDAQRDSQTLSLTTVADASSTPMSSAEGSLAKTSPTLVNAQASTASALDSGPSSPASSTKSNRRGSSSKTFPPSGLVVSAGCSVTFPRAGMMRNGTAYQLPTLAPLIVETASGLLPTPSASRYGTNQGGAAGRVGKVRMSLDSMATRGLLKNHAPGPLHPRYTEWLMGFPIGWTDLSVSETQSYPRSLNSSEDSSSEPHND
jgi:hypothetical protein